MKHNAALVHLPIGLEKECEGIIDLVDEKAIYFEGDYGEKLRLDEIPQHKRAEAQERRHELIEHLSNVDDRLGIIYFFMLTGCLLFLEFAPGYPAKVSFCD